MKCPACQFDNPADSKFCKECGTRIGTGSASPLTQTLERPRTEMTAGAVFAGRYQIVEELGAGGMGSVFRAVDKKLNEEVALKLIRPEIALDKPTLERFHNELKLARKISHRHVGRMYELMQDNGRHFITMEYVAGQDLRALTRQTGRLTISKAVSIAGQVCEGLAEAHRLGIVHRDLKPSNIIIDKQGNARIMDFGIARSIHAKSLTGEGVIIGTPEYMSPEQVEGKNIDPRSDIYSLGVILFEMVTGRVPFEGDTPFTIGIKHKSEKPQNPKTLNPQIPDDLSRLILKCLSKDAEARYPSAEAVRADLLKIEKSLPTTDSASARKKPLTSRTITVDVPVKKILVPVAAVIVLFLAGWGLFRLLDRKPAAAVPSGKPTLAVLYFENMSGDRALDPWKTGIAELLITKLAQSRFINVLDGNTIYSLLRRLDLDEVRRYTKEDLARVASAGGANYTLSGSLIRAGQNIVVSLSLQNAETGDVVSPISLECAGEEQILSRVDEVAGRIKADLKLTSAQIASDIDKKADEITTRSAEAFKYYSEGRRLHIEERYQDSIDLMKKAVALDPEFAMAYRSMGSAYGNLKQNVELHANYQAAFDHKARVSDRERFAIEGDYYRLSERTYGKAIESYESLLELYPDDIIANTNLGVVYSNIEEWDKAIDRYQVLLKRNSAIAYGNLVECYLAKGDLDKARAVLLSYLEKNPGTPSIINRLAWIDAREGRTDLALDAVTRALGSSPGDLNLLFSRTALLFLRDELTAAEAELMSLLGSRDPAKAGMAVGELARLYAYQGRMGKAVEQLDAGLDLAVKSGDPQEEALGLIPYAYINSLKGDFRKALSQLDSALESARKSGNPGLEREILRDQGIVFIGMKSVDKAEQAASRLKALCEESPNRKAVRLYLHLRGALDIRNKRYAEAIDNLERATSLAFSPDPSTWDLQAFAALGEAYLLAGEKEKALEQYRKIVANPMARFGNVYVYVTTHFELGRIYQGLGRTREAGESYGELLRRWKDADPDLPLLREARTRLAALKDR